MAKADQRNALVTGASGSIGGAFVERLAAAGYRVFAASRPGPYLDEATRRWAGRSAIVPLPVDLTRQAEVEAAVATVERLDLLVNNAGAYLQGDGGVPPLDVLQANLEINLLAQYRMIQACLPLLAGGVIINVSSGAGAIAATQGDGPLGYRVSKAAFNMLTRSLAGTLRQRGIAVHAADPGYVRSRLNPDGSETPEQAVDGMWHLVDLRDPAASGHFWLRGQRLEW